MRILRAAQVFLGALAVGCTTAALVIAATGGTHAQLASLALMAVPVLACLGALAIDPAASLQDRRVAARRRNLRHAQRQRLLKRKFLP